VSFEYRIENAADDRLLAAGWTKHCFLDHAGRPVRIEGELRALLEGRPG
jgi:acyl-CoA thioesterase FadM